MDLHDLQRVDRRTWQRYLFYIDLVMIAVLCISLILVIRHTFLAGQLLERAEWREHTMLMWQIVADTVFFVGSLCWLLVRFFRTQYVVLTRRF